MCTITSVFRGFKLIYWLLKYTKHYYKLIYKLILNSYWQKLRAYKYVEWNIAKLGMERLEPCCLKVSRCRIFVLFVHVRSAHLVQFVPLSTTLVARTLEAQDGGYHASHDEQSTHHTRHHTHDRCEAEPEPRPVWNMKHTIKEVHWTQHGNLINCTTFNE